MTPDKLMFHTVLFRYAINWHRRVRPMRQIETKKY